MDMFESKKCYVLWTISMCTTSLHSKFREIVLWYEYTRMIWMDLYVKNYFALVATLGGRRKVIVSSCR